MHSPPRPAPAPEPELEPPPAETPVYLVTAQIHDLPPGTYDLEVHLVDHVTTEVITAATSGPFTVPPPLTMVPRITTPQVHEVPPPPSLATRRR